jgi:hypothetical protein
LLGGNAGTQPGQFLGTTDNQPLEFRVSNQPALRISLGVNQSGQSGQNVVGGLAGNSADAGTIGATISGGGLKDTDNSLHPNHSIADYATIAGGFDNFVGSAGGVIGGGSRNKTTDDYATVSGGLQNFAQGNSSTVGGGFNNVAGAASGLFATVAGGTFNQALGEFSTIPGGDRNLANATSSLAAGHRAVAAHPGAFVWGDSTDANFSSINNDEFAVRARGGVRLDTGGNGLSLDGALIKTNSSGGVLVINPSTDTTISHTAVYGVDLVGNGVTGQGAIGLFGVTDNGYGVKAQSTAGTGLSAVSGTGPAVVGQSTTGPLFVGYQFVPGVGDTQVFQVANDGTISCKSVINTGSDRNSKTGFSPVNPAEVLDKVVNLPISEWQFKADKEGSRHLGPTAQDFFATFNVGTDERHIATVDEGGVALAAIQGLNTKLVSELQAKDRELRELRDSVVRLEAMVNAMSRGSSK